MGYGHRPIALTQLLTPDWQQALTDMNRRIELFPGHDPEAYRLRAWIHENLRNNDEAESDHRPNLARQCFARRGSERQSGHHTPLSGDSNAEDRHYDGDHPGLPA